MNNTAFNVLTGDFRQGFTSADARAAFDGIADRMTCILKIIENPKGLSGSDIAGISVMARMAGLEADSTAGDVNSELGKAWGLRFIACEVEAQALAAGAIEKARVGVTGNDGEKN